MAAPLELIPVPASETIAVLEYEPAAQAVHVELPFVSEYVPSVHGMHAARP